MTDEAELPDVWISLVEYLLIDGTRPARTSPQKYEQSVHYVPAARLDALREELTESEARAARLADWIDEILDAVDNDMSLARAEELAKLWQAGKLIGGDAHGVSITLYTALTAERERFAKAETALRAELEAAKRDAERYRWLVGSHYRRIPADVAQAAQLSVLVLGDPQEIDAAIERAAGGEG